MKNPDEKLRHQYDEIQWPYGYLFGNPKDKRFIKRYGWRQVRHRLNAEARRERLDETC